MEMSQDDSRWFQRDPYSIDPAELDPVALALSPYRRGTYYDVASQSMRPTSSLLYPSRSIIATTAASRRRGRRPMSKRARIPASTKAILGLKEVPLTTTTAMDDNDCAICLRALADPADQDKEEPAATAAAAADVEIMTSRLRAMPCCHIFHQHCIFQWLHRNAACPLCRHQLPTTDDDDDDGAEEEEEDESPDFWFQVSIPI